MKNISNIEQHDLDFPVKVSFEVICNSHTSMIEGYTLKERILNYIYKCIDAMDESMRHWGDNDYKIEPVKVEIFGEDNNSTDVTSKVLGKINPDADAIPETLNNLIKDVKKYVIELNNSIPHLMECPKELPSSYIRAYGRDLHTDEPKYSDPTYWIYPEGVEEKIEDDKYYKVWYTWKDASDPADSTTWNYVKYIQHIPIEKNNLKKELENILKLL